MTRIFSRSITLLFISTIVFSCATIVSKSSYPVSIETVPTGANVSITDKKGKEIYKGKTPAALRVKSGAGFFSRAEYQVKLTAPGYDERVVPITFKLNNWYFGNVVIGGLIGMLIVDPATGAMWRIDKESSFLTVTLTKSIVSTTEPTLKIIDIKDIPEHLKKDLVQVK
jgi:hypothetical protein